MPTILIICTANQCRSPVGEALLRKQLTEAHGDLEWQVESAGTWAANDRPAHPDMRVAAMEAGLDLATHRARNVDTLPLEGYDLLLTMEQSHKEALEIEFPAVRGRTHLLSTMAGVSYDVPDPIGGPPDEYRASVRELDRLIRMSLPRIVELATAAAKTNATKSDSTDS